MNEYKQEKLMEKEREKEISKLSFDRSEITEPNVSISNTLIPPLLSSNCLPSRSTVRSSKESNRPYKKKMVVMSLSKVNSILPDKYQMSLEPMYSSKREPNPKQWRSTRPIVNAEVGTQTESLDEKDWCMMKKVETERSLGVTNYKTWRSK